MKKYFLVVALLIFSRYPLFSQVLVGATIPQIKQMVSSKGLFKLLKTVERTDEHDTFVKLIYVPHDNSKNIQRTYTIPKSYGVCTIYETTQPIRFLSPFYQGMREARWSRSSLGLWVSPDGKLEMWVEKSKNTFTATYTKSLRDLDGSISLEP